MVVGSGLMALSYIYLSTLTSGWAVWQITIGMVFMGLGLGQMMQTLTIASQNAVEAKDIGVATSSATFFRQMGGTLGVAVFLSILFNNMTDRVPAIWEKIAPKLADPAIASLPGNANFPHSPQELGGRLLSDSSFLKTASPELAGPVREGFAESAANVFFSATIAIVIGFAISLFIKELALRNKSGVQEKAEAAAAAQ